MALRVTKHGKGTLPAFQTLKVDRFSQISFKNLCQIKKKLWGEYRA